MKEHERDVFKATNAARAKMELVDHCLKKRSRVWLCQQEQRWGPRKFMEPWFICRDPTVYSVNHGPLLDVYSDLIKRLFIFLRARL